MTFTPKDIEQLEVNREIQRIKDTIAEKKADIKKLKNEQNKQTIDSVRESFGHAIATLQHEVDSLDKEADALKESKVAGVKQALRNIIDLPKKLDIAEHKHMFVYISHEGRYIHLANTSTDPTKVVLDLATGLNWQQVMATLNGIVKKPGYFDCLSEADIRNVFEECQLSFNSMTATFNPKLSPLVFNLMEAQRKWWAPRTTDFEYHEMFDDVMMSLGGGEEEQIQFLEQYFAYKYLYPERSATIPNLNITGQPGGNGKLIYMIIGETIFTSLGVSSAKPKTLKNGFNAVMLAKTFVNFDDPTKEDMLHEELKQITGNETITIEFKGMNSFVAAITFNIIVTDNVKSIRVVGGGEDRRWSIIETDIELVEYVKTKYKLTHEQALDKITDFRMNIASNRDEVSKWLSAMIDKYGMEKAGYRLLPLHADAYKRRLFERQDSVEQICEAMIPVLEKEGSLPFNVLAQVLQASTDVSFKINLGKLVDKFNETLARKGLSRKFKYHKERVRVYYGTEDNRDKIHHINTWYDPAKKAAEKLTFENKVYPYNFKFDFNSVSTGTFRPTGHILEEELCYDTLCADVLDYAENPVEATTGVVVKSFLEKGRIA